MRRYVLRSLERTTCEIDFLEPIDNLFASAKAAIGYNDGVKRVMSNKEKNQGNDREYDAIKLMVEAADGDLDSDGSDDSDDLLYKCCLHHGWAIWQFLRYKR